MVEVVVSQGESANETCVRKNKSLKKESLERNSPRVRKNLRKESSEKIFVSNSRIIEESSHFQPVKRYGGRKPPKRVRVLEGGGGVGHFAISRCNVIQMLKQGLGIEEVCTTCSTA